MLYSKSNSGRSVCSHKQSEEFRWMNSTHANELGWIIGTHVLEVWGIYGDIRMIYGC